VNIKSQKDFVSGLMFMGIGGLFTWGATAYSLGTGARMGPGYFPMLLGVMMAVLGAFITFNSLVIERADGDKIGKWAYKPLFYIIAANLVFGICLGGLPSIKLPAMGMIVGIFVLTFVASMAEAGGKIKSTFILATTLALISYVAFVKILNLQFPVWPAFITG
jgi:Tripartite tricarboxylate transporter TctB family